MKRSQLAVNSVSTIRAGLNECLVAYQQAGFHSVEFQLQQVRDFLKDGYTPAFLRDLLTDLRMQCIGGFD